MKVESTGGGYCPDLDCPSIATPHFHDTSPIYNGVRTEHTHQFTIPVEWKTTETNSTGFDGTAVIMRQSVTKLRCNSCPEEIHR